METNTQQLGTLLEKLNVSSNLKLDNNEQSNEGNEEGNEGNEKGNNQSKGQQRQLGSASSKSKGTGSKDGSGKENQQDSGEGTEGNEGEEGNKIPSKIFGKVAKNQNEEEGSEDNEGGKGEGDESAIEFLYKKHGFTDEQKDYFKDIDFKSNDLDQIDKYYSIRDEAVKNSGVQELFEAIPEVEDLARHLSEGKTVDTWKAKHELKDWGKVQINKDNKTQLETIVREDLKQQGLSDKRIEVMINALKDGDELFESATESVKALDDRQKSSLAEKEKQEQKASQQREREAQEVAKNVQAIIKNGKIGNYVIPEAEKKDIANYILSDARNKLHESLSLEEAVLVDIFAKKLKEKKLADMKFGAAAPVKVNRTVNINKSNPLGGNVEEGNEKELSLGDMKRRFSRNSN